MKGLFDIQVCVLKNVLDGIDFIESNISGEPEEPLERQLPAIGCLKSAIGTLLSFRT